MVEEACYEVVERLRYDIELRRYSKQIWVLDYNFDRNLSFMKLLAYIEGQNKEKQKMEMTVPVVNGEDIQGPYTAFILPKEITQPPKPLDGGIKIMHLGDRRLAVISFHGIATPESFEREKRILEKTLKNRDLKIKSGPYLLQYSKPWTPPLEQRNEIAYEV